MANLQTTTSKNFSSFSEIELVDFAEQNGICLSKSELIYLRDYAKANSRDFTACELSLFSRVRAGKNKEIHSIFDKVRIDSENPHIADTYARYLRLTEQQREKLGTYPCLYDLADASHARAKNTENNTKSFCSVSQKISLADGKSEEGKYAFSLSSAQGGSEDVLVNSLMNLFESRYLPFSLKVTGEYKEPSRELVQKLSELSSKIGISASRLDVYDTNSPQKGVDNVLVCGYAQANSVARHYPKEEDYIIFIEAGSDKAMFIRKLSALFSDRKIVRLIVDGRYAQEGLLMETLYEFVPSFSVQQITESGIAFVVRPRDKEDFVRGVKAYGLSACEIGRVTSNGIIACDDVNIPREVIDGFEVRRTLDVNLAEKKSSAVGKVGSIASVYLEKGDMAAASSNTLSDYKVCSQKGLVELYDYAIGGLCVLAPLGGKYMLTPAEACAYKFPVQNGGEDVLLTATATYPSLCAQSPFMGAVNSVVCSVVKLVLSGARRSDISVCVNKVYPKGKADEAFSALLGAFSAREGLGLDTCKNRVEEGEFSSFTVCAAGSKDKNGIIHNVFDRVGRVYKLALKRDEYGMIDYEYASRLFDCVSENIEGGNIISATMVEEGGAQAAIIKSCIGNGLGFVFDKASDSLFKNDYGDLIVMCLETAGLLEFSPEYIGTTDTDGRFVFTKERSLNNFGITQSFTAPLEGVYRTTAASRGMLNNVRFKTDKALSSEIKYNKPSVLIPVFDASLNESELAAAFKKVGADPMLFRIFEGAEEEACLKLSELLDSSCILALPDGIGDEDKICSMFRRDRLFEGLEKFIGGEGLIYGVGLGARALCSLGLVTGDKLRKRNDESITYKLNNLGRPTANITEIRVASVLSPWLYGAELGEKYLTSVSAQRGAITFAEGVLEDLIKNGQIATQYVDNKGFATMESPCNPTGSVFAVEGLTSKNGRVFVRTSGAGTGSFTNRAGNYDLKVFESGVKYFK